MPTFPIFFNVLSVAFTASLVFIDSAAAQPRFDYHSIRGRQPLLMATKRCEGETDFELRGKSRAQDMRNFGALWSGDAHLLWDGVVGESLQTSFEVDAAGVYDLVLQLTIAPDYGILDVMLDGTDVCQSIDTYNAQVGLAPLLTISDVSLAVGRQAITFKLTGSNVQAQKFQASNYLMGLDYLELKRKDNSLLVAPVADISGSLADSDAFPQQALKGAPLSTDELTATMKQFCFRCHGGEATEAKLDLSLFGTREILLTRIEDTQRIRDAVARREMPPKDERQPPDAVRARMLATVDAVISDYLKDHRSHSPVVMRRLNRYEYSNAVRDLLQLRGDVYPLPEKTIRADNLYFDPASGRFPNAVRVSNRTMGKEQIEEKILTSVSPFAIDLQADGGFNNRGNQLSVSPILLESFLTLGRSIVDSPEFDAYCKITDSFFTSPQDATLEQQQILARMRLLPFLELAFRSLLSKTVMCH